MTFIPIVFDLMYRENDIILCLFLCELDRYSYLFTLLIVTNLDITSKSLTNRFFSIEQEIIKFIQSMNGTTL